MFNRRQVLSASGAMAASTLLSACVTEALFKDYKYDEVVSSVLISTDKKSLVFIGKDYHYIFDAPEVLVKTLEAPFHQSVTGLLRNFHAKSSGEITGDFTLVLGIKVPEEAKQSALAMGYRKSGLGPEGYGCILSGNLVGKRFLANNVQIGTLQQLNSTYTVQVSAEQSKGEKAAKLLATPITVAIDGVLILGSIPLIAIGVGVFSATCPGKCK